MAPKTKPSTDNPGMILVITYLTLFVINILVIYLANLLFPQYVVLGTAHVSKTWAILHTMGILALVDTFAIPFFREIEKAKGKMFTSKDWMAAYFILNFVGVWLITRLADQLGFGITSWVIAAILAVILNLAQGIAMMQLQKLHQPWFNREN